MFQRSLMFSAAAAVLLCSTSAFALTTDQVWAEWQAAASAGEGSVTAATEAKDGTTLRLNGVKMAGKDGGGDVTISEVVLTEEADGSVAIRPGDITVTLPPDQGSMAIKHNGLVVTVHEDAGGRGYGVTADAIGMIMDIVGQAGAPGGKVAGNIELTALNGRYSNQTDGVNVDLSTSRAVYNLQQVDPAAGLDSDTTSDTADIKVSGKLAIPAGVDLMAIQGSTAFWKAVSDGLAFDLSMSQGVSKGTIDDRNPAFPLRASFEAQPGTTTVSADGSKLRLETQAPGLVMEIAPAGAPAAIPASADMMGMTFEMPITAPEGGAFELGLTVANLVLGEGAWAMFDPSAALPRDPADLRLLLQGTAKMDLAAITLAEEAGTAPPVPEPLSLDIKELGLKLAGAALSGTGAFTFDNSMLAMGGPPMPIGTANMRLEGGNKLIDALIAAGLLPEQDAMGARMMMAMFGKPEGDDILTSQIEAKEGGSIFVNGQQIQ